MRRRTISSSIAFANHIVQVSTDAKARPTMTVLTTISAAMNMPHGDRSRGKVSAAPGVGGTGAAAAFGIAGVAGEPTGGALMAGAEGASTVGGVSAAGCVCAEEIGRAACRGRR